MCVICEPASAIEAALASGYSTAYGLIAPTVTSLLAAIVVVIIAYRGLKMGLGRAAAPPIKPRRTRKAAADDEISQMAQII